MEDFNIDGNYSKGMYNQLMEVMAKLDALEQGHKQNRKIINELTEEVTFYEHSIETIGTPSKKYITRYRLDLEIKTVAAEIRIYADESGKFQIPADLTADVSYGNTIRGMAAFLYSEGVVSNDRICMFINSISGNTLSISEGSIYGFCKNSERCVQKNAKLLNSSFLILMKSVPMLL